MKRKLKLPDGKTLFELLKENNGNLTEVGKMFQSTGSAVRYVLQRDGYPFRSSDYRTYSKKNYKRIFKPDHPKSSSDGMVPEHIVVAEKKLGRYLKETEVVHHIDEDKHNNNEENLLVFATNGDHVAYHNNKELGIYKDGDVWRTNRTRNPLICAYCNKEFIPQTSKEAKTRKYCSVECSREAKIKDIGIANIVELQQLLRKNDGNFSMTARSMNVTANALVKRLKSNNLPYHSGDYKT